jgi:16S rRNA (uracil1498-N3)-methyltransferase
MFLINKRMMPQDAPKMWVLQSSLFVLYLGAMHYFFAQSLSPNGHFQLSEDEWKHIKALRIRDGESLMLVDGQGGMMQGEFHLEGRTPSISMVSFEQREHADAGLHLYIPMTQHVDRIEWMLEKCTEMGLASLHIINTAYAEPGKYSVDRLHRVALAAMKQSQRAFLPKVVVEDQWTELLQTLTNKNVFVAHCYSSEKKNWKEVISDTSHVFIGPEGDFSEDEVNELVQIGAVPISLGDARLRAETAGMLVVAQYYSR